MLQRISGRSLNSALRQSQRYSNVYGHRRLAPPSVAFFHSSRCRRDESPRSPFTVFVEVLKEELRKNREFQESVKQLQGDVDKFQDSEAMKKARAAYERARVRLLNFVLLRPFRTSSFS